MSFWCLGRTLLGLFANVLSPCTFYPCWGSYMLKLQLQNYHCMPTICLPTCLYDILEYPHICYTVSIHAYIVYSCATTSVCICIFSCCIPLTSAVQDQQIVISHTRHQLFSPSIHAVVPFHPMTHDPYNSPPYLPTPIFFSQPLQSPCMGIKVPQQHDI